MKRKKNKRDGEATAGVAGSATAEKRRWGEDSNRVGRRKVTNGVGRRKVTNGRTETTERKDGREKREKKDEWKQAMD